MTNVNIRRIIGPLLIVVFLFLLYFPVFQWLVNSWIHSDYYSHGFLIIPIAAVIAWTRRRELRQSIPSRSGIWILIAGLAIYVGGFVYVFNFLGAVSLLVVLAGLVVYFLGRKALISLAFPIFFLIFMIPLPFLDTIGFWMQSLSASSSAWVIGQLGIPVTRTGAEIHLGSASFVVGMPCSGMNSLIALLALAALFAYILNGSFARKTVLFILAIPVAIFANLLRLMALLLVGNYWGAEAATGFLHTAFSPVFFIVSIICLVLISRLLRLRFGKAV